MKDELFEVRTEQKRRVFHFSFNVLNKSRRKKEKKGIAFKMFCPLNSCSAFFLYCTYNLVIIQPIFSDKLCSSYSTGRVDPRKNGVKQLKATRKIFPKGLSAIPLRKTMILVTGSKCSRKGVSGILQPFAIYLE